MTTPTFASPGQQRVYDRIARGPCFGVEIIRECGIPVGSLGRHIRELTDNKYIIVIGRAEQAGRADLRFNSPMFALRGTPLLPPLSAVKARSSDQLRSPHKRPVRGVKHAPGSGVISKGRYVAPIKEIGPAQSFERGARERAELAMLSR